MERKNKWFLCIRKLCGKVTVQVMSSEEARIDPPFSIVGTFSEQNVAYEVRAVVGDDRIIANWQQELAINYGEIQLLERAPCFSEL